MYLLYLVANSKYKDVSKFVMVSRIKSTSFWEYRAVGRFENLGGGESCNPRLFENRGLFLFLSLKSDCPGIDSKPSLVVTCATITSCYFTLGSQPHCGRKFKI